MQRTNVILYCNARKIGCSGEVPSGAEHESAGSEYSADQGVAITTRAAVIEVGARRNLCIQPDRYQRHALLALRRAGTPS